MCIHIYIGIHIYVYMYLYTYQYVSFFFTLPQNVFSKKLLSTHYNYVNLQIYTSAAALVVQLPLMLYSSTYIYIDRFPL